METMQHISLIIWKIIWAIVGGAISIAFIVGSISALAYMAYYIFKNGWKAFDKEFIPR
jgi:hypothetical protein